MKPLRFRSAKFVSSYTQCGYCLHEHRVLKHHSFSQFRQWLPYYMVLHFLFTAKGAEEGSLQLTDEKSKLLQTFFVNYVPT